MPCDDRASRQRDVDVTELPAGVDLNRERRLTWVFLTVGAVMNPALLTVTVYRPACRSVNW